MAPPHHLFACDVRRRLTGVSLRAATIVAGHGVLADSLLTARASKHSALVNVLKFKNLKKNLKLGH